MIIAICGKKGSGKSTLAKTLQEEMDSGASSCHILSLALPIKNLVHKACGDPPSDQVGNVDKTYPALAQKVPFGSLESLTYRSLYQAVGQAMRNIHPDFWIKTWERSAEQMRELANKRTCSFIVDDVRYANEVQFFQEKGALMVRLLRDPSFCVDQHPSEQEMNSIPMDRFDVIVPPQFTVEQNKALVLAALACHKREGGAQ